MSKISMNTNQDVPVQPPVRMGRRLNCCWHYLLLHLRFWYFDTSILGYLILLINDFGDLNGHLCCLPPTTTAPDTTATMNKLPSYYREWRYPMDTRWRTGQKMASLHAGWRLELLAQSPALSETRHLDTWILDTSILRYLEIWYFWSTTSWRHAPSLPVWPPTPPPLPALLTTSHLATTTSTTTTTTTTTEDTPPLLPTLLSSAAAVPVLSSSPAPPAPSAPPQRGCLKFPQQCLLPTSATTATTALFVKIDFCFFSALYF